MPAERLCKVCGTKIVVYNTIQNKCRSCTLKNAKPIPQQGKHARLWVTFRDKVAIPYLDKKYGHVCAFEGCTATENLDVDHIKNRGSNPDLRYDVKNLQYLCRKHHQMKTGQPQWTKKP